VNRIVAFSAILLTLLVFASPVSAVEHNAFFVVVGEESALVHNIECPWKG